MKNHRKGCNMDKLNTNIRLNKNIKTQSSPIFVSTEKKDSSNEKKTNADSVNISNISRKRLEKKGVVNKRSGETSAREAWEDNYFKEKNNRFYNKDGTFKMDEFFKESAPEKYQQYLQNTIDFTQHIMDEGLESAIKNHQDYESQTIFTRWMDEKLLENPNCFINPSLAQADCIDFLDVTFSDGVHNTSFDVFSQNNKKYGDLWRFQAKFNVQLTANTYNALISGENNEQRKLLEIIKKGVSGLKETELLYEGNKKSLMLGIRIYDDYSTTYHAHFNGGNLEDNNLVASSAQELLNLLMAE